MRTSYCDHHRLLTTHQVSTSIKTNLLVLKAQLCALRQYSIDPRSTPVYHKYFMFRRSARALTACITTCTANQFLISASALTELLAPVQVY